MSDAIDLELAESRDRKALAVRIKLGVSMLTTFGYSLFATALIDPIVKRTHVETANLILVGLGLASLCAALVLAPQGEAA